jgi:CRP-like cAMP-binding protein
MQHHAAFGVVSPVGQRLMALGLIEVAALDAFGKLLKVRNGIAPSQAIVGRIDLEKHLTVLLEGFACLSTQQEDGHRQIHVFYHPGDFLGLHGLAFPQLANRSNVQALVNCSIGTIHRDALEQAVERHPDLGRVLWGAAMMEASIFRRRLFIARRPGLERVAHLLCEVLTGLGIDAGVIPLTQIDVADAAGLSAVHTNRIFQELRQLGVLSENRCIEVVNKEHLQQLASFDGHYLNPRESLSQWDLRFDLQRSHSTR